MPVKNILTPLIAISVIVSSTIFVGIRPVSALQGSLAGCDEERSENRNVLSQIPGYPAQNPKKNIYHITAFRKTPGVFIVITRDNKNCALGTEAAAVKKFSVYYPGQQPQKLCEFTGSALSFQGCKPIKRGPGSAEQDDEDRV